MDGHGETMTPAQKILVIDDEGDVGEFVSATAQALGFDCTSTTDATAFLKALTPDTSLILLDLIMPEMDGIELLRLLGERKCKSSIVLMSGVGKRVMETAEQLAQVLGLSVVGHLEKPFRLAELEEALTRSVKLAALPMVQPSAQITSNEELRTAIERNEFVLHYQP
jgi:CheY-like chemotaxis protein